VGDQKEVNSSGESGASKAGPQAQKKAGVVAIIGRPNVGKSTLLNALVGEKVAIVSPIPQTTRHQIRAILNDVRGQVIFVDTPGMHVTKNTLDRALIVAINDALQGADELLHLVDVTEYVGEEEAMVMDRLGALRTPVILALNKIDAGVRHMDDYLKAWEQRIGKPLSEATNRIMPVPISAKMGTNMDRLLDEIWARLPPGPALYPDDILTDFPRRLTIQDVIREKLLCCLRQELPFSIAVYAEEIIDRSDKLTYVRATIIVERDSQKGIVIGHKGAVLRKVGEEARRDLVEMYGKKFFLELRVKVEAHWKTNTELLRMMGYIL
jgi:GTP-binding protein Era